MKAKRKNKNSLAVAVTNQKARVKPPPAAEKATGRPKRRTILVPVDLPEISGAALDYAWLMAARINASVLLLHVIARSYAGGLRDSWSSQSSQMAARREILRKLSRVAALAKLEQKSTVQARFLVREGLPHYEILRLAQEHQVGLIILGRHSRGPLSRMIFGSTSGPVMDHAPCPVVVVPEHERIPEQW